jgi:anti-anti-sigma factor
MAEPTPLDAVIPRRLEIGASSAEETTVLVLVGELDIASAPAVDRALEDLGPSISKRLVIDLAGVTFMDSTGLRALLLACKSASDSQRELVLRPGPYQVQRVFELSGTLERFVFEEPPTAAWSLGSEQAV